MDGSQLLTEWTHLNEQLVPGVSDSKMKDAPKTKNATSSKKGPISKNVGCHEFSEMSKMSKSSMTSKKNLNIAEKAKIGTNR
jgi:hypothetical protein